MVQWVSLLSARNTSPVSHTCDSSEVFSSQNQSTSHEETGDSPNHSGIQPSRAVLVTLPFGQAVVHIEQSRPIEDVRRRLDSLPIDDLSGLVSSQVRAPHAAASRLRVHRHHARTARLAPPARLVRLARHCVGVEAVSVWRTVCPSESARREVHGVNEGTPCGRAFQRSVVWFSIVKTGEYDPSSEAAHLTAVDRGYNGRKHGESALPSPHTKLHRKSMRPSCRSGIHVII